MWGASYSQSLGTNYSWADSATVNVVGRDSTFSTIWESVSIWVRGGEGWIKYGAPDTNSWNSRKWIRAAESQIFVFDQGNKLRRLHFKANSGVATFYFFGYKKRRQF
jgi:hypothetical protein